MDLVSFDTKGEFEMFAEIMKRGNYIFKTSDISKFSDKQLGIGENFPGLETIILACTLDL